MKLLRLKLYTALLWTALAATPPYSAFSVEVQGKGPAMFLIPGATSPADVWRETAARYSDRYRVHLFTLAGYAGVPPLSNPHILPEIKRQLINYIKENQSPGSVLIGHSIGGFLGLWLATEAEDLPDKMVIVDALPFLAAAQSPSINAEQARQAFLRYKNYYLNMDSATVRANQQMILQGMIKNDSARAVVLEKSVLSDRRTMGQTMYELMSTDLRDALPRISIPLLVLVPWDAPFDSLSGIQREQKLTIYHKQYAQAPNCRLRLIENSRHFIMLDQTDAFHKEIDAFLSISPSSGNN